MPKINVYLPDDLATAVRELGLSVSPVCQQALAEAVRRAKTAREAAEALRAADFDPRRQPRVTATVVDPMTTRLRRVLASVRTLAGPAASAGTGHLLLGMLDDSRNLGAQVLGFLDIDIPGLRRSLLRIAGTPPGDGELVEAGQLSGEEILAGLSPPARRAVAAAVEAAADLNHDFLGTEHVLLALAALDDDPVAELLRHLGARPDAVRRSITTALAGIAVGSRLSHQAAAPMLADRLEDVIRRLDDLERRVTAGGL
ncbi:MAG: type II toxin-antitoxin system CcdA family antitoxin [Nocardiopsaceae bacterium]|nr:type II toxin-antitoxin system CcdA family antitoxin [Nocardiopsaceae bacterium]